MFPEPIVRKKTIEFISFSKLNAPTPMFFNEKAVNAASTVISGQLACTASRRQVWLDAATSNQSHVLILEDDNVLTPRDELEMQQILPDANQCSTTRAMPRHWIFLDRIPVERTRTRA
jgi:Glycosyltransferase family 25 (LPS biosynthesis protein)